MMLIECGSSNETQLTFCYVEAMWRVLKFQIYRFILLLMPSDEWAGTVYVDGEVELGAALNLSLCLISVPVQPVKP